MLIQWLHLYIRLQGYDTPKRQQKHRHVSTQKRQYSEYIRKHQIRKIGKKEW